MSKITLSATIKHTFTGIADRSSSERLYLNDKAIMKNISLTTAAATISSTGVAQKNELFLKLISGDPVQVGFSNTVFEQRLQAVNDFLLIRLNNEITFATTKFTAGAQVADGLDGLYVELREVADAKVWFWFDSGAAAAPTVTTERLVPVVIASDATAAEVAAALSAAIDGDSAFRSTVSDNIVTAFSIDTGAKTASTEGTSGWAAPTMVHSGEAPKEVYLKSLGTSEVTVVVTDF